MKKSICILFAVLGAGKFCIGQSVPMQVKYISIALENDSILKWTAVEVKAPFIYVVQQYRWERWVDWDTLTNTYGKDTVTKSVNIEKYICGGYNKFRVRAVGDKMLSYSKSVDLNSTRPAPKVIGLKYDKKNHIIDFGRKECYELYNKEGKLLQKGYEQKIGVMDLSEGNYFLNYEKISVEIKIK